MRRIQSFWRVAFCPNFPNESHVNQITKSYVRIYDFTHTKVQAETVNQLGADHPFTHLVIKSEGDIDPDDSFSSIPYEKGFSLLYYLQSLLGVEKFEGYLKETGLKLTDFVPANRFDWRL